MAEKKVRRRTRRRNRNGMAIIACVVLVFCIVLMYNSAKLNDKLSADRTSIEELQSQIDEQSEMKAALEEKSDYMNSDEYYKELAREKLGLAGSDDIIFKKAE
ncbi:MAG: hypothetical protein EOM34_16470 [Clostridia bacterium]|jgi:cell division protein DivIC|nr:septum formation initiator family protein [Lachnospiraceae bacterium]NCC02218.1 hypothetical protein [Clostridia bacterium]NCD04229.1 hypothetical protein [Clostridia bacterium]